MEEDAPAQVHDHEEDSEDDAISLSDLPITPTTPVHEINTPSTRKILPRRSSSEPADFFEFLHSDDSIIMSHAEDIFFCGKLVPFDPNHHHHHHRHHLDKRQSLYRRRSESFPDPIVISPRGSGTRREEEEEGIPLIRRKKLRRNFSSLSEKTLIRGNNSSSKSSIKSEISSTKSSSINSSSKHTSTTSRWLFLIFGFAKPLPEMELSDIKSRQVRRAPTTMFPRFIDVVGGKRANSSPGGRRRPPEGKRRSSWRLLSVLSCRSHTSVAVTTPFGCLPAKI